MVIAALPCRLLCAFVFAGVQLAHRSRSVHVLDVSVHMAGDFPALRSDELSILLAANGTVSVVWRRGVHLYIRQEF